jgi:hypothetical protein
VGKARHLTDYLRVALQARAAGTPHPALRRRIAIATHEAHGARDVRLRERLRELASLAGVAAAAAALLAVAAAHAQDTAPTRLQALGGRSVALVAAFDEDGDEDLNRRPRYDEEDDADESDDEDDDEAVDHHDDADD